MSTAIVAQAEGTLTEELDDEFPIDLAQLRPIPMRKSLLLINNFVTNTTRFLNHFSHVCEEKLLHVSTKLMKLEIKLALLEAKLNSIPDLEDTPVEEQDDVLADGTMPGFVRPDEPSLAGEGSEIAPPPPPPTTEKNEAPKLPELALVPLPPPPPPILSDVVPPSPPAIPDLDLDDGASEAPSDIGIPPPPSLPPRSMMMEEIASRAPPALEESVSDPAATTIPPPPPPALSALESLSLMSEEVESSLPVEDDEFSEEEEEEIPSPSSFLKLKDDPEFSKYFKMRQMGMPDGAILQKIGMDGARVDLLDLDPEGPSPNDPAFSSSSASPNADTSMPAPPALPRPPMGLPPPPIPRVGDEDEDDEF